MFTYTIKNRSHLDNYIAFWYFWLEDCSTVWFCKDSFINSFPNFSCINIKSSDYFNVSWIPFTNFPVHKANCIFRILIFIIIDSLYKGTCTVSYSYYSYFNFAHIFTSNKIIIIFDFFNFFIE